MSKIYWNALTNEFINNVTIITKRRIVVDQVADIYRYDTDGENLQEVSPDIQTLIELLYVEK